MAAFCTLFDSRYLDKGLALYESLCNAAGDFRLYVFAFDQAAYDILTDMSLDNMIVIHLKEFETDRMLQVKKERSAAEYCWTCTPITIEYVLERYNEPQCTYLDADLYFFSSPDELLREIEDTGDSVIITEHRFPPERMTDGLKESGKYCVQFNTFTNDTNGRTVLSWWKERCLEWCFYTKEGDKKGDQKYLESWTAMFSGVHELQHLGGGVAPWNVGQYSVVNADKVTLSFKGDTFALVFYHFQNIRYLPFGFANLNTGTDDKQVKKRIYIPYMSHIERIRRVLGNTYNVKFDMRKGYFTNPILRFIQDYIMPFRVRRRSDIIWLWKLRRDI